MIKELKYIIATVCLLSTAHLQAQQLPAMTHYIYNPYLINPARAGQNDFGQASLHFRKEWSSLPSSPITGIVSLETPIRGKLGDMGLGGMLYVDNMHILTKIGGMASYAYHIPFEKNKDYRHGLSAGLSLGFIHQQFNFPDATVENPNDNELIPSMASGTAFDFSAGLDYQWRGLHIGVSMLQGMNAGLMFHNVHTENIEFVNARHWMFSASYKHLFGDIEKKNRIYIQPVFLVRYTENVPFQAEGNFIFGLDGIGWIGLGYRSSNNLTAAAALSGTIGVEVKRKFIFSYTFEAGIDPAMGMKNTGTQHEFMVAYRFQKVKPEDRLPRQNLDSIVDGLNNRMDTMDTKIENNRGNIEKQGKDHQQMKQGIDKNSSNIENNRLEIERLRELINNSPSEYKKVGEVFFAVGSHELIKEAKANLDAVKGAIEQARTRKDSEIKIYVKGNASLEDDAQDNMALSMRRATAVRQYLIEHGINGDDIMIIPMGEYDPTDGLNDGVKTKDRRVDIIFTEKLPSKKPLK